MRENGYEGMPPMEEKLASYLSVGETSSLKAPSLPSKPLQKCAAAGQAVASLHTMAVLQAYQADLLKDLDKGRIQVWVQTTQGSWPISVWTEMGTEG